MFEEVTVRNFEVRIGAIYALERIAKDSLRDHIQIMEILCAYVRENAPGETAEKLDLEAGVSIRDWSGALPKPRTDIQTALEVIGRRSAEQIGIERAADVRGSNVGYRLDLRDTNLQRCDIAGLNFDHAQMNGAHLEGADLRGAHLDKATDLSAATLRGAALRSVALGLVSRMTRFTKPSAMPRSLCPRALQPAKARLPTGSTRTSTTKTSSKPGAPTRNA